MVTTFTIRPSLVKIDNRPTNKQRPPAHPPARPLQTQTGPITIHCAAISLACRVMTHCPRGNKKNTSNMHGLIRLCFRTRSIARVLTVTSTVQDVPYHVKDQNNKATTYSGGDRCNNCLGLLLAHSSPFIRPEKAAHANITARND